MITTKQLNSTKYECDECSRILKVGEFGVNIGENSNCFENDTRQAYICLDCLEIALKIENLLKNSF